MAQWFECRARYDKMQESGKVKKVNEPYLVDALSFSEAEARFIEEVTPYISGDFTVTVAKHTKIAEIFNLGAERYYLAKVAFITIDERTGVEKRSISQILVGGSDFDDAYVRFCAEMKGTLADTELVSLAETPIMDVYPAKLS